MSRAKATAHPGCPTLREVHSSPTITTEARTVNTQVLPVPIEKAAPEL